MSCEQTPISITPCEFPMANSDCPIGYTSTNCINFQGEDDSLTGVEQGELLTLTLDKIVTFVKNRTVNSLNSNTLLITKTSNNNGVNFGLEVNISSDEQNQLTYGSDGLLYSVPFSGEILNDSNSIDLRRTSDNKIEGHVKYVQSPTINLSSTPSGLKADLHSDIMARIATLESKVTNLENSL